MALSAIAINCTLKRSGGEASSTDRMIGVLASAFARHDVSVAETLRIADYAVMPGVTVTLTSDRLITGTETTVSDANGSYRFDRLPPGSYAVKFELQGFKTIERAQIALRRRHQSPDLVWFRDIPLDHTTAPAQGHNLRRARLCSRLVVQEVQRYIRTFVGEAERDGSPDASLCASDQDDLARTSHVCFLSASRLMRVP